MLGVRAIGKTDVDHGGVLGLKTAGGAGLHTLDGNRLAQQIAEQVDVVNQVDQDRAGTLLAAPLDIEILVILIDHVVEARHGELAQLAGLDDLLGLVDEGVVATVLTYEHGHAGGLGLGGEGWASSRSLEIGFSINGTILRFTASRATPGASRWGWR